MIYNELGIESELITLDCKMRLRFVKRPGFISSFVGLAADYGSNDFNFELNGKKYYTKSGIAHFIEHKCFSMPDGSDAFFTLTDLGVSANAYTSNDKTLYFFKTVDPIYKPLSVLLDMIFTKGFTKENIEHEKNIIISEINMYSSNLDYQLINTSIKNMFLNTGYAYEVAGTIEDVSSTTLEEIELNYAAFYHPSNLILTVVGDIDKEELVSYINKYIKKYEFAMQHVSSLANLAEFSVNEELSIIHGDIEEEKYALGIRLLNVESDVIEETLVYDYILDRITSDSSEIYQKLLKKKIINPDIYYELVSTSKTRFILINGSSTNAKKTVEYLKKLFSSLEKKVLNKESFENFKKSTLSENIRLFDNIFGIGETIMDYDLSNVNYFDLFPKLRHLSLDDVEKYLENINKSKKTMTILVKEEK